MSRGHAHRLMGAVGFMEIIKTSPRGDVFPKMEAQVRPLLRLPDPEQQVTAWVTAVERAEGGQPSAPEVKKAVLEILPPEGPVEKTTSRGQQRLDLIVKLKEVTRRKKSWDQVRELIEQLEALIWRGDFVFLWDSFPPLNYHHPASVRRTECRFFTPVSLGVNQ